MKFIRTGGLNSSKSRKLFHFVLAVSLLVTVFLWCQVGPHDGAYQDSEDEISEQENSTGKGTIRRQTIVKDASLVYSSYPGVEAYVKHAVARLNMKPLTDIEPLIPRFGAVLNNVTSFHYPIEPLCRPASTNRTRLFIAIISAPGYIEKRQSIRNTWLRLLNETHVSDTLEVAGHAFVVGNTKEHDVKLESETHGDILHIDFEDTYRNLTIKTVALMNWLRNKCSVDYVLKVDDDVYVNVRNLVSVIASSSELERTIFGLGLFYSPLRSTPGIYTTKRF